MADPRSEWQKFKRVLVGFFYDYLPVRTLSRFIRLEWQGLQSGRALAAVIGLICLGSGFWIGHEIGRRETKRAVTISQARNSSREWPPLTEAQIQEWVTALKPYPRVIILVQFEPDVEAIEFYRSLKTVGGKGGWEIYHGGGSVGPGVSEIQASSTMEHQATAHIIVQLLNRMNYPTKFSTEAGTGGTIAITIPDRTK